MSGMAPPRMYLSFALEVLPFANQKAKLPYETAASAKAELLQRGC